MIVGLNDYNEIVRELKILHEYEYCFNTTNGSIIKLSDESVYLKIGDPLDGRFIILSKHFYPLFRVHTLEYYGFYCVAYSITEYTGREGFTLRECQKQLESSGL